MSLNNSILTKRSKPGDFPAHVLDFRLGDKHVQAVRYYGIERSRPIFSACPDWLFEAWRGGLIYHCARMPGADQETEGLFCRGSLTFILPNQYVIHDNGFFTVCGADHFEDKFLPVV